MKKIFVSGLLVVTLLAAFGIGLAFAQDDPPPPPEQPYGYCWEAEDGDFGWQRCGDIEGTGYGPMHELLEEALAEVTGLSHEEIEERHAAGESMYQIAESAGLSEEEILELFAEAHPMNNEAFQGRPHWWDSNLAGDFSNWIENRLGFMRNRWNNTENDQSGEWSGYRGFGGCHR
jgi:hypothetical protein